MEPPVSRFQERLALLVGSVTLVSLGIPKRHPRWGGLALMGIGVLAIRGAIAWLHHSYHVQPEPQLDVVTEGSEESFPASDAPAWVLGVH